ncbi:MAG: Alpha-L-fucosidase [Candidatus Latescibacteria bacterium ADurb.Bin168]|nr:MAG: Alpha-L-fucosidase [Candidatus Latescibacteria bacterium ADurb.Bin168]
MRANTDWFRDAKWGVFMHWLATMHRPGCTVDEWNAMVDAFDVDGLANQLAAAGAGYLFFTVGQIDGFYACPNEAYDRIVGIQPSKCSRRDLVSDLSDALAEKGIRLLVYLPAEPPYLDKEAVAKFPWVREPKNQRQAEFQTMWEGVIRDFALRCGTKIWGWWFDGCYYATDMYRHPEPPNFASFAAAAKAGNPQALVAFNQGVHTPVKPQSAFEDYTAGEISDAFPVWQGYDNLPGRFVGGAQYHILSYLAGKWGYDNPRFPDEFVIGYTKHVNQHEGVVTWDVPNTPAGLIREPFMNQLTALGRALGTIRRT